MSEGKLPEGWVNSKFTDLMDVQGGTQPPKSEFIPEAQNGYIRLLQIRDFGKKPVPTYIPESKKLKTCREEDLLIGRYGASLGRICTGHEGAYNVALAKVIYPYEFERSFIRYYLESEIFQFPLRLLSRSAQNGFNKEDLSRFDFLLAPLAEQKIIADKLDTLLAQVDSTKARLEQIPQILKRFRQAVLAAAVSGKLTEEWRGTTILTDWKKGILKNFIKKPSYGTSAKSQKEGLIPVLRMGNLQSGKLDWSDLVYTSDKNEIEKYKLIAGDILFNRTNSPELVGKTSIYRGEREAIYAGYLIKIQCLEELNPEYLNYHLNSHIAKQYCYEVKSDGVSQSNINAQKLAAYPLEVPPIKEQTEIVRRVEQLFAYADGIEKQVQNALERVNNLTQSILAKAFRGELTAQWRAENPDLISGENSAQALLAKIQQQRANTKTAKRGSSKR
ncbi:restriction endonuclease subunit S [Hafnia alvei]|uniref:restriction endonuclease subunit S n=1 Tax=Hafnia alvei TaxID=569 RepID=UPI000DFC72F9|nr:restriction endonuclease subunit S [Hafnia alvei]STQ70562.1 Type I restriction enzyme EcoKI specificity protein [Hafnia alvei]